MKFLSDLSESLQLMFRRPHRVQFAALCYRRAASDGALEVLLLTSRDTGRWVIPKGWPMGDRPGYEVAAQEALEEAGVIGEAEHSPIGFYRYDKGMGEGLAVPCRVQVHALAATEQAKNFKEKGKRNLEWVSPKLAAARVAEPELKAIFRQFEHNNQQH